MGPQYYFNPAGKRFRSRQEVRGLILLYTALFVTCPMSQDNVTTSCSPHQIMKALGLDDASKRLPREEAVERAAAAAGQPDLQPPLALTGDVTVQRLAHTLQHPLNNHSVS